MIFHCKITSNFPRIGLNTFITLVLLIIVILFSNQALLQEAKYDWRKQTVFFTSVDPRNELQKDELHDVTKPRQAFYRTKWKVYQNAVNSINLKKTLKIKDKQSGKLDPMLLSFMTAYEPTVSYKW